MRVSTDGQNPNAQRDALLRAGVAEENLYVDHTSGAKSSRPPWDVVFPVAGGEQTLRDVVAEFKAASPQFRTNVQVSCGPRTPTTTGAGY